MLALSSKALKPVLAFALFLASTGNSLGQQTHSIARQWNEQLLSAIRLDEARPTVHARNLFHLSVVMWDAWAVYDQHAKGVFYTEKHPIEDHQRIATRDQTISHAAYTLLQWRFKNSPNIAQTNTALTRKMAELGLGLDLNNTDTGTNTPATIGNRIAQTIIKYGLSDGANEQDGYKNRYYQPVNQGVDPSKPGNPNVTDPDRWQPLNIPEFVGQSGLRSDGYPPFVGPEWGDVTPFSLSSDNASNYIRDGKTWRVYFDPGPPPKLSDGVVSKVRFKQGFEQVIAWSGELDASNGKMIDISPASRGNNTLGTNNGKGYPFNPATQKPYVPHIVPAGDYYRVLAEFWADGPSSETPPGHWFTILNLVSDQPALRKKLGYQGRELDALEWDVKSYLALGGAMHDVAIAAWSNKGWYDYTRPISAIRYLCERGQATDPDLPNYHADGINLRPGIIEQMTAQSAAAGERHHEIAQQGFKSGEIAIRAWRGPDYVENRRQDVAGVGWIACKNWWPYQRPNFVTPPFAGYVSGHSTYSRAAAEVLTLLTGTGYFPGGMGRFIIPKDTFLFFEKGPSRDFELQWATYQDAADECSLSRIYGGIHPPADDIPGRLMGYKIGHQAFAHATSFFNP